MSTSKKIIVFTIFGALVLTIGVFAMVAMTNKNHDVSYMKMTPQDQSIGSWSTKDNTKEADSAKLTFKNKGKVSGQVSGYAFSGTYEKLSEDNYVIFNKKRKETYTIEINEDEMNTEPVSTALTVKWTLWED